MTQASKQFIAEAETWTWSQELINITNVHQHIRWFKNGPFQNFVTAVKDDTVRHSNSRQRSEHFIYGPPSNVIANRSYKL